MDYVILFKKFHFILTPLGMIFAVTMISIALLLLKFFKIASALMLTASFSILLASTPWLATLSAKHLLSDRVYETPFDQLPDAQAMVVFSWLTPVSDSPQTQLKYYLRKLTSASRIHKIKHIPILVSSSKYPVFKTPEKNETTYAQSYLARRGVDNKNILILPPARNSFEGALFLKKRIEQLKMKSIILIESDLKMPRKYMVLKKLLNQSGIAITAYSNRNAKGFDKLEFNLENMIPNTDSLDLTTEVLHEWFGILAYRWLGWI